MCAEKSAPLDPSAPPFEALSSSPASMGIGDILLQDAIGSFQNEVALNFIFNHTHSDIKEALNSVHIDSLNAVRNNLITELCNQLPQYKDHRVIKRQNKKTLIPDIINIGYSVINGIASKDLEKVFKPPLEPSGLEIDSEEEEQPQINTAEI